MLTHTQYGPVTRRMNGKGSVNYFGSEVHVQLLIFFLIYRVTVAPIAMSVGSLVKMFHTGSLLCFLPDSYHACATT